MKKKKKSRKVERLKSKILTWKSLGLEKPESQTSRNNSLSLVACPRSQALVFLSTPPLWDSLRAVEPLFFSQCVVYGFRNIAETDIAMLQQEQQMLSGGCRGSLRKVYVSVSRLYRLGASKRKISLGFSFLP